MMLAAVDPVTVVNQLDPVLGAIIAGLISGCTVGVAIGIWVATLSSRLRVIEERLKKGDNLFEQLSELSGQAKIVSRELDGLSGRIGTFRTIGQCDERHRVDLGIGQSAKALVSALDRLATSIDGTKGFGSTGR